MDDQSPVLSTFVCPSCGNESSGKFCSGCGEKRLGSDDRSLRHYFDIVINFLTHFDSKAYRSLRYLIAKPGFLSVEQIRGSRVRYAKPFALFLSINVVYYFSIALIGANTFTTPLSIQLHKNDYYPSFAKQKVENQLAKEKISYTAFEEKYNEKAGVLSKTLIFLFIPIYGVLFYGIFFRCKRYFVEHMVVATHLWAFILLLLAVVVPVIAIVLMWWFDSSSVTAVIEANDNPISILLQFCIGTYLVFMFRRVYAASYWYGIIAAALIAWSFFQIVWLYRFLLFMITLYSV